MTTNDGSCQSMICLTRDADEETVYFEDNLVINLRGNAIRASLDNSKIKVTNCVFFLPDGVRFWKNPLLYIAIRYLSRRYGGLPTTKKEVSE